MAKIHIMGASGSGTSTLGAALSKELGYVQLDTDDYYWKTKYTEAREISERIKALTEDFSKNDHWILSGSLCGWGNPLIPYFELVIFLYVPPEIRLERLQQREFHRYGSEVLPGGSQYEDSKAFLEWASLYDGAGPEVRSKFLHEKWLSELSCPVLRIEGTQTVEERVKLVLDYLSTQKMN